MIFSPEPIPILKPTTIHFDLNRLDSYQSFVTQVRNLLKDPKITYHDLPIIREDDTKRKDYNKYFYIQLNAAARGHEHAVSVTLQIRTSDLYVVAYHDLDDKGKDRVWYFEDLIKGEDPNKEIFPDVKKITRKPLSFKPNYEKIEAAAHMKLDNLHFVLPILEDAMRKTYRMSGDSKTFIQTQAFFLLYSIVMTSEAARFKYVEQEMVDEKQSDYRLAGLVQEWGKLSEQIVWSKNGDFETAVVVKLGPGETWIVKTVAEIKDYMGLLKYVKPKKLDTPIDHEL
ncbi:hypothetical protein RND81_14G002300 [Saponaria officinalis]|uniref:rRNA N-glycosylase n=1 Tax=Saponaria officinalis TaxID=3572 RepID=A0AAW1GHH2_SAPOF